LTDQARASGRRRDDRRVIDRARQATHRDIDAEEVAEVQALHGVGERL